MAFKVFYTSHVIKTGKIFVTDRSVDTIRVLLCSALLHRTQLKHTQRLFNNIIIFKLRVFMGLSFADITTAITLILNAMGLLATRGPKYASSADSSSSSSPSSVSSKDGSADGAETHVEITCSDIFWNVSDTLILIIHYFHESYLQLYSK